MKIEIKKLEKINKIIFKHLESIGVSEIEVHDDMYWNISKECLYNPYKQPGDFTLGQLTDDYQKLLAIVNNEKEVISYALVWLASIYRALGEKIVK